MSAPTTPADPYLPQPAIILQAELLTAVDRYFLLRLTSGETLHHLPGQFLMVSVPGVGEAALSIASSPNQHDTFELVARKVGRVTGALHALPVGGIVGIRGPLGTHYPVDDDWLGKDLVFIGGGCGIVPMRSAMLYLLDRRDAYGAITILYGTRTPADRLFPREAEVWKGCERVTLIETVDRPDASWTGRVGVVPAFLPELSLDPLSTRIAMCGPPIVYKFVIAGLAARGVPMEHISVSLERRLKCGVGKCGHCQINGLLTCRDGAVFNYAALQHVPEAI